MKIGFDFDQVMNDMLIPWCEELNKSLPLNLQQKAESVVHYNMKLNYPTLSWDEIFAPLKEKSFWLKVKPKEQAKEIIEKLQRQGHEVFIVTASFPESVSVKYNLFITRYFPSIDWEHIIITSRKDLIKTDVMVDDNPNNLKGYNKLLLLYKYKYNEDAQKYFTCVSSWKDIEEEINKYDKI